MFIIETNNTASSQESVAVKKSELKTHPVAQRYQFDEMAKLRALFLGLIRQKRWIYFLNDKIKLRAEHLPVLQIKLKEHHCQYDSLQKLITTGHCSAVVVERNNLDSEQLEHIYQLSLQFKVQLILLENIQDSETLH